MPIDRTSGLRQAQHAALDFCTSFTKCAIGLFEPTDDGGVRVILPLTQFEPYCKKLRAFPEGDRRCQADHIKRARQVIDSGEPILFLCHAGVFNKALPLVINGEVRAVLMYGQMWVEGDHRSAIARMRHESTVRRLQVGEDDELELRIYYDDIKRLSRRDLDLLDGQLSSLQRLYYEMLSEEQERGRQTEEIIHDLQTRLQPVLALAENLYYGICRVSGKYHSLRVLQGTADELLKSALAMRVPIWNLGNFMPEYQFKTCPLEALVEEAIELYSAEAERKEVYIHTELEKPSSIEMSRLHLQHAVNNLLHNAIKYSFRGGHDRYRYVQVLGKIDGTNYVLTFSNFGVGILPEEFDLIFQPGYKGKLTYAEYRSGSGMGLAITKEIIERHHGIIEVESVATGGDAYVNKFVIRLPLKQTKGGGNENRMD